MSYWKNYWNKIGQKETALQQVQRDDITAEQMLTINKHIIQLLELKPEDTLLDVCCGNGLLSWSLSKSCKSVVGVDFSSSLITSARAMHSNPNLSFVEMDATKLSHNLDDKFDKILLYFSFQYFDYELGQNVLREMKKLLKPGGRILIGDVPDKKKFWTYYNTLPKCIFYFKQWLFKQPKMGKFWSEDEMKILAEENQLKGAFLEQNKKLPHAHYRFDYLLSQQ